MEQKPERSTRYVGVDGKVSDKFRSALTEILGHYVDTARFWADKAGKPREDFFIRDAYIVGSVLRGIDNSDLDILLIADKIDNNDYKFIKQVMAQIFFNHRSKPNAIDVYIRPTDEFPDRARFEVTNQVEDLIGKYNQRITSHD